jgi:dTMP kinase
MSNELAEKLSAKLAGKFIVLDGPDGCGKSTQVRRLAEYLRQAGGDPLTVRDPGDTDLGNAIREILLGEKYARRDIRSELMLFMASRAQLVAEKIRPALSAGRTVLSDRYVSSSCAYQGAGGLDVAEVIQVANVATNNLWPELTIVLDVDSEKGFDRIKTYRSQVALDAMEQRGLEFHRKVRDIFLKLPSFYPRPVMIRPADGTVEQVQQRILETLNVVDF